MKTVLIAAGLLLMATAAQAQDQSLRDLCPDRPAKGTAPCTVDAGHLQLEIDLADITRDRHQGERDTTRLFASPLIKLGVTDTLDIEAGLTPYIRETIRPGGSVSGVGDLTLKAKLNLTGNRDKGLNLALAPFVIAPTATHGLGDGGWEGGLVMATAHDLPHGWSLNITPEIDALRNQDGGGVHPTLSNAVGLTHEIAKGVSATGEVWLSRDLDPAGHTRQASGDVALAWIPSRSPNLQWDVGLNLGLDRNTPDIQGYIGLARRF